MDYQWLGVNYIDWLLKVDKTGSGFQQYKPELIDFNSELKVGLEKLVRIIMDASKLFIIIVLHSFAMHIPITIASDGYKLGKWHLIKIELNLLGNVSVHVKPILIDWHW